MTVGIRALLAALVIVAVSAASALFIGYRTGVLAGQRGIDVATTGDISTLFDDAGAGGTRLVDLALQKLESAYYKPVDPQTPVAGEVGALRGYLHSKHVAAASFPASSAANVLSYAQAHYSGKLGPHGDADLTDAALRGIMASVKDPYTVYLSPREIQGLNESLDGGNFGGIGVYIYQLKDGRIVVQPIEAMPAFRAGMKPGEVVDTVDGKAVKGLPLDRVEEMIRGESGTSVRLT
ncbi:MAG: PDZ domain-containing protein, partial [Candidatus Eremiobacteraeota bacterium]|nr:PDZ domain-containing protein [Candidatus Eremiobacteraeota bacterium]